MHVSIECEIVSEVAEEHAMSCLANYLCMCLNISMQQQPHIGQQNCFADCWRNIKQHYKEPLPVKTTIPQPFLGLNTVLTRVAAALLG